MFDNIGRKIKMLAKVACWIGIIASLLYGVTLLIENQNYSILGYVVMIVGSLLSWLSSFTLYGFGELIEKVSVIADEMKVNNKVSVAIMKLIKDNIQQ